jgi:hypothetical protein
VELGATAHFKVEGNLGFRLVRDDGATRQERLK